MNARVLLENINQFQKEGKSVPEDIEELTQGKSVTLDAWKHELRLELIAADGRKCYVISSAGPDGVFETEDDLHISGEKF